MKHHYPHIIFYALLLIILPFLFSCGDKIRETTSGPATQRPYTINHIKYYPIPSAQGYKDTGLASWYGPGFHGRTTSNGERYDMHKNTAAHKILPMNTMVLVKNLENGKETVVRINDRGPFVRGRIIDLSLTAAKKLGIVRNGTAKVKVTALTSSPQKKQKPHFTEGSFFVQIGSFTTQKKARRLQNRFLKAGHKTVMKMLENGKNTQFLVQVYAGSQIRDAIRAESALLDKGYSEAFIVAN
jgi:rare lipoprotein A